MAPRKSTTRKSTAPRKRQKDDVHRGQDDPQRRSDGPQGRPAEEQTEDVVEGVVDEHRERSHSPGDEDIDNIGRPVQLER